VLIAGSKVSGTVIKDLKIVHDLQKVTGVLGLRTPHKSRGVGGGVKKSIWG